MAISDDYGVRSTSADLIDVSDALDELETNDSNIKNGWAVVDASWSYASSTTITVPSGAASAYQKGDKLKLDNATTKYFNIVGVADTVLTVTGGSDYTVANSAISNIYISRADKPFGWPTHFNWVPTLTGFSADPTSTRYLFQIINAYCIVNVRQGGTGTSNATSFTMTPPLTAATISNGLWGTLCWQTFDNSAEQSTPGRAFIASAGSSITIQKTVASGTWTASGGKMVSFTGLAYPI